MDKKEKKVAWSIEIGFYPGIVVGIRSYEESRSNNSRAYIYRL